MYNNNSSCCNNSIAFQMFLVRHKNKSKSRIQTANYQQPATTTTRTNNNKNYFAAQTAKVFMLPARRYLPYPPPTGAPFLEPPLSAPTYRSLSRRCHMLSCYLGIMQGAIAVALVTLTLQGLSASAPPANGSATHTRTLALNGPRPHPH